MATTTHCDPKTSASSPISSGRSSAAEFTETLSAPASSTACASATVRMPPPIVNGMKTSIGGATGQLDDRVTALVRGRDVEEDELVGPLGVVAGSELDRIARVAQADEVRALDDAPGVDVEAGDDALQCHALQVRAPAWVAVLSYPHTVWAKQDSCCDHFLRPEGPRPRMCEKAPLPNSPGSSFWTRRSISSRSFAERFLRGLPFDFATRPASR